MIDQKKFLYPVLVLLLVAVIPACDPGNSSGSSSDSQSVVGTEDSVAGESLDWSTVSPEDLWFGVETIYQSDGPEMAMALLERGVEMGVVTGLEAGQVRAIYLYELGRLDEAFLSLLPYQIDTSRTDLLLLRADVLWGMARYEDALRDYRAVLESQADEPSPDIMFAVALLADATGDWELSTNMRDQIFARPDHPVTTQVILHDLIKTENPDALQLVSSQFVNLSGTVSNIARVAYADMYADILNASYDEAIETGETYLAENGFDTSIAQLLLRIDTVKEDYVGFESRLEGFFEDLDAAAWLENPFEVIPPDTDRPIEVGSLLDSASALELGRDHPIMARLHAIRARTLNPYDYVAHLQLAAVEMYQGEMPLAFENLVEALRWSQLSDIRTRLRMIQFAPLLPADSEIEWDEDAVLLDLGNYLAHWEERYPDNSFYRYARAELTGYNGDIDTALNLYEAVTAMPGASPDAFIRYAYWMARSGDVESAENLITSTFPAGSPYATWVRAIETEAVVKADPALADFALRLQEHFGL